RHETPGTESRGAVSHAPHAPNGSRSVLLWAHLSRAGERVIVAAGSFLLLIALPGLGSAETGVEPAPPTAPIPAPLTLADAVRIFHERGFDLLLADASVASATGDLAIARALPNPQLSGSTGHTFDYNPDHCDTSGCSRTPWNASVSDQGLLADLVVGKRR